MQKLMLGILTALFIQFSMFTPQSLAAQNHATTINVALKKLQEDKPAEALTLLKHIIEQAKPEKAALLIAGNAYMQLDQNKKALAIYQKGSKLFPDDQGLLQNKAIALYYLQRFKQAGNAFLQLSIQQKKQKHSAEKNTPVWFKNRYQAAVCFYKADQYAKAMTTVQPLVVHTDIPQHCNAKKLLAHCYIAQEKWKKASFLLEELVEAQPRDRSLWMLLANICIRRNHLTKASSALQIAYSMQPPTHAECVRFAKLYMQVHAPLLASKMLSNSPEPLSAKEYDLLALAYEKTGNVPEAVKASQQAIALKNTTSRQLEYGKLLYRNQMYSQAIQPLKQAYTKLKKKGLPLFLIGQCYMNAEEYSKASEYLLKAQKYKSVRSNSKNALSLIKHIQRLKKESSIG